MSYCHLINGVGINFANGFGPQPAQRIFQYIDSSDCLSSDCINTCITQISDITVNNITSNAASVTWNDATTTNTSWQVSVSTYPFEPTIWETTTSNSYTFINLSPNTYYTFNVRPICINSLNGASRKAIFATSDDFCLGKIFTDTGGPENVYDDNENWIRVVAPIDSNNKVKVIFSSIDLELNYDYLYIFDGLDASAPSLTPSGINGNLIVGPFQSTADSGALTFQFISDGFVVADGWNGNFSCQTLGVNDFGFVDFSYYPNPVSNKLTIDSRNEIQNITIYSIDGKLLYEKKENIMKTTIDLSNYEIGNYIMKLNFNNKIVSIKVLKN